MSDLDKLRRDLARAVEARRSPHDRSRVTTEELLREPSIIDNLLAQIDIELARVSEADRAETEKAAKAEADAIAAAQAAIARATAAIAAVRDEHRVVAAAAMIDAVSEQVSSCASQATDRLVPATRALLARVGSLVAAVEQRNPNASLRAAFIAEVIAPRAR